MIPKPYKQMHMDYPEMMAAYEAFGEACREAGPLDSKTIALIKLAISLGAGLEGGAHSHTRKALEAGCSPEELIHVAILCAPTLGFPTMMRAKSWVQDTVQKQAAKE
jgi:4-carboxymuconolactone decarboxylase